MTAPNGAHPQPPPQAVEPSPVPNGWAIGSAVLPGGQKVVVIQVSSPTGTYVVFVTPDQALMIGGLLTQQAHTARTGLILPG